MRSRIGHVPAAIVLAAAPACGGASRAPAPGATAAAAAASAAAQPADVHAVLHARSLAPEESLAVRLLGTVGPDGSWSLRPVGVQRDAGGVRLAPQVQHGTAANVIQMVMPLDERLWLRFEPGVHRLEVVGRDSTFRSEVRVAAGLERPPPETHAAYEVVSFASGARDFIAFTAWSDDGFADAIEVREHRAAGAAPWYRLQGCAREGTKLVGRIQVPGKTDILALEGRAVDGQGALDPSPAYIRVRPSR
jgi:hypothetical protein